MRLNEDGRTTYAPADPANNHLDGNTYDQAGNLAVWGTTKFFYDPHQKVKETRVGGRQLYYLYDANDERAPGREPVGSRLRFSVPAAHGLRSTTAGENLLGMETPDEAGYAT